MPFPIVELRLVLAPLDVRARGPGLFWDMLVEGRGGLIDLRAWPGRISHESVWVVGEGSGRGPGRCCERARGDDPISPAPPRDGAALLRAFDISNAARAACESPKGPELVLRKESTPPRPRPETPGMSGCSLPATEPEAWERWLAYRGERLDILSCMPERGGGRRSRRELRVPVGVEMPEGALLLNTKGSAPDLRPAPRKRRSCWARKRSLPVCDSFGLPHLVMQTMIRQQIAENAKPAMRRMRGEKGVDPMVIG